jgi:hypothetical protein
MVLLGRIELPTSPLPRVRSTTELQQRRKQARPIVAPRSNVNALVALSLCHLSTRRDNAKAFRMSEDARKNMSSSKAREERLAAKLRENLRRRKAQARALGDSDATESLPNRADDS